MKNYCAKATGEHSFDFDGLRLHFFLDIVDKKIMKEEKGFSLIEMCFVVAGISLIFGVLLMYYGKLQTSEAGQSESLELADHYRVADTAFRKSFQDAGFNFTLPGDHVFGGEYPLYFQNNENWQQIDESRLDGSTYQQRSFSRAPLKSNLIITKGSGSIVFNLQGKDFQIGLQAVDNDSDNRFVEVGDDYLLIRENGEDKFTYIPDLSSGTRQNVYIALEYLQERAGCVTNYYLEKNSSKNLIYRSENGCPRYPVEATASNASSTRLSRRTIIQNLKISGAAMISREPVADQNFIYPSYNGQEIYSPILQITDENDFGNLIFLGGSVETDVYYTSNNVVIHEGIGTTIKFSQPNKSLMASPIADNDVINLIDFGGRQSVLGIASSVTNGNLIFTPLDSSATYDGFYTLAEKYNGHSFGIGASLVKVAPPTEWTFADNRLLQRSAGMPWQTVILGVNSAKIRQTELNQAYSDTRGTSIIRSYYVDLNITQDGTDTALDGIAPQQLYHAVYTPPALNRDSNN